MQNKLDGCYYAVKRIQVNPASRQFRRIKGEVTLLSRLNHENIVRYYNAWIERHETPATGVISSSSGTENSVTPQTPPERGGGGGGDALLGRDQGLGLGTPNGRAGPRRNELGLLEVDVEEAAPPPALASSVEWSTSIEMSSSAKCSGQESSSSGDEEEEADVFGPSFL